MKNLTPPHFILRFEGLITLIAGIFLYTLTEGSWLTFALLLFVPDVAMVGYLVNNRFGSWLYNLFHTYTLPLLLGVVALALANDIGLQLALIWIAHIGMDRVLGFGLKYYDDQFQHTHFSQI